MREGIYYLRVKVKSLDEEIRIIRKEMKRACEKRDFLFERHKQVPEESELKKELLDLTQQADWANDKLVEHMRFVVKAEYRNALLALGFLKGKPYAQLERFTRKLPNWERVERLCKKYGEMRYWRDPIRGEKIDAEWQAWYEAAREHIFLTGGGIPDHKEAVALVDRPGREERLARAKEELAKLNEKEGTSFSFWQAARVMNSGGKLYVSVDYQPWRDLKAKKGSSIEIGSPGPRPRTKILGLW